MKAVKQIQFFAQYNLIIANPNFNLGKKKTHAFDNYFLTNMFFKRKRQSTFKILNLEE